ncbi:nuclease PIN, partial [Escherichia coli]|nr:nuclease PIN [Escherichia coli]
MKLVAARVFLAVLMAGYIVNNVLYANERVKQEEFLHVDETRHQWVNERNGRTGMLVVSGALLSSPCT